MHVAELSIDDANQMAEYLQVMSAHLDNHLLKLAFVRASGNPNAPWTEIMRWHQAQQEKGQTK